MGILKDSKRLVIAGPCSVESCEQLMDSCTNLIVGEGASGSGVNILRGGVWKPRTKPGGFEGVGEVGLKWLEELQKSLQTPVATEVATTQHVELALKYNIKVLWIGARTTVNPIIVQEIAKVLGGVKGVSVMVKNPMHPDIALWLGAVERLSAAGVEDIALIHRGFSGIIGKHKYRNQPQWNIPLEAKRLMPELPLLCDPSHIAGNRELIFDVTQEALNLNYDGLIIETHRNPNEALSDSEQQITPKQLLTLLEKVCWREENSPHRSFVQELEMLRSQIDNYDTELFDLLSRRMQIAQRIGKLKAQNNVAIHQSQRWNEILKHFSNSAQSLNLSENFITQLLSVVHNESIEQQNKIFLDKNSDN